MSMLGPLTRVDGCCVGQMGTSQSQALCIEPRGGASKAPKLAGAPVPPATTHSQRGGRFGLAQIGGSGFHSLRPPQPCQGLLPGMLAPCQPGRGGGQQAGGLATRIAPGWPSALPASPAHGAPQKVPSETPDTGMGGSPSRESDWESLSVKMCISQYKAMKTKRLSSDQGGQADPLRVPCDPELGCC